MENASKAIIISGAVLIAILLISLGIALINSTSGVRKTAEDAPETVAIQTYNQKFEKYIGEQRGARIIDMVSAAINLESDIDIYYVDKNITYGAKQTNKLENLLEELKVNGNYKVENYEYDSNGRICKIRLDLL